MSKSSAVILVCALALAGARCRRGRSPPCWGSPGPTWARVDAGRDQVDPFRRHARAHRRRTRPSRSPRARLDMIFAKPLRQRLVDPRARRSTHDHGPRRLRRLGRVPGQRGSRPSHRLNWLNGGRRARPCGPTPGRTSTFTSAPEGGSVEDKGPGDVDGVDLRAGRLRPRPGIVYQRYFDRDSGRLVLTDQRARRPSARAGRSWSTASGSRRPS